MQIYDTIFIMPLALKKYCEKWQMVKLLPLLNSKRISVDEIRKLIHPFRFKVYIPNMIYIAFICILLTEKAIVLRIKCKAC